MTEISTSSGWNADRVADRKLEIQSIKDLIGFDKVMSLGFPTKELDKIPTAQLVMKISSFIHDFQPEEIFVPHPSDVHSDHQITYNSVISATKWFRALSVKRILAYETLSETGLDSLSPQKFVPNYYVNIEEDLHKKIEAFKIYESEIDEFPFPRSILAIESLARLRGTEVGFRAAEAFQLIREAH